MQELLALSDLHFKNFHEHLVEHFTNNYSNMKVSVYHVRSESVHFKILRIFCHFVFIV